MAGFPVFILSDFGTHDTYAAQMRSAILSFAGYDTPVVDLTHQVPRGNVTSGAFHLRACLPFLPPGSVTLAVVDPGVGTERRGLAALWRERLVVCPDNGLISFLTPHLALFQLPPPDPAASSTFHGRDWFAPCAARLSVDPGWTDSLQPLEDPVLLRFPGSLSGDGSISATVIHVDGFGNSVLSIESSREIPAGELTLKWSGGSRPLMRVTCYQEAQRDKAAILRGSQGFWEIAFQGGSAGDLLGLTSGEGIEILLEREDR
ncbi:MAG TPA: SAM-dependent chlorinase/fluorinase [Candidatus Sabulitectum sp.]|nr:SAM-dependent chlorinase/fluorinase [Candidatus Sabulitectum sp.]HPR23132.1 SAM-dependent chlorinase/fluorinase [Candidatus Sabulitectum sp.]